MKLLQGKLTYANVMATIAVFIALGGSAYAATQLKKNSVGTKQLKNGAVTAQKIKNGAITGDKIQLSSLGTVPSAASASQAAHAAHADTAQVATTANALLAPETPHFVGQPGEPEFEDGVANFKTHENLARFWKDRQCVVHLAGTVTTFSFSQMFQLPPADFPESEEVFAPAASGSEGESANIEVFAEGQVISNSSAPGAVVLGLDSVSFRAATC